MFKRKRQPQAKQVKSPTTPLEPMETRLLKARIESLIGEVNFLQREVERRAELSDTWDLLGLPNVEELAFGWQLTVKGEIIKKAIEESLK